MGRGVFATEDIKSYELICAERPTSKDVLKKGFLSNIPIIDSIDLSV